MSKHKQKLKYKKSTLKLKDNHTWNAPKGYKIVVLERGAVSFNMPYKWLVEDTAPFTMHDAKPPDDNARLSVSYWKFAPGIDWTGLPLDDLLLKSTTDVGHEILEQSPLTRVERDDIELLWIEQRFLDAEQQRQAYSRIAVARGFDVCVLMTFDLWVDDSPKFQATWDEILRSLQLGRVIEDPTKGAVLQ
jgi:hypothetical protein